MTIRFGIYLVIILIVFIRGCWVYKNLSNPFKILCILMGFTFLSEALSRVFIYLFKSSMYVYPVFAVIQYACFALIFHSIYTNKKLKTFTLLTIILMVGLCILNSIYLQPANEFPSNFLNIMFTLVIFLAVLYLKQAFDNEVFSLSILYFTCTLIVYLVIVLSSLGLLNYFFSKGLNFNLVLDVIFYSGVLFYSMIGRLFLIDITTHNLKNQHEN